MRNHESPIIAQYLLASRRHHQILLRAVADAAGRTRQAQTILSWSGLAAFGSLSGTSDRPPPLRAGRKLIAGKS